MKDLEKSAYMHLLVLGRKVQRGQFPERIFQDLEADFANGDVEAVISAGESARTTMPVGMEAEYYRKCKEADAKQNAKVMENWRNSGNKYWTVLV